MTEQSVTCITCSKSGDPADAKTWHPFQHPLNTGDDPNVPNIFKRKLESSSGQDNGRPEVRTVQSSMPFDPVLRQALIDKGVISLDDLRQAEEKIFAITGMMTQGVPNVPRTDDSR